MKATLFLNTELRRFERDIADDWTRVTGGASSWQNTDGVLFRASWHASYDLWIDDIRLSNGMTVERNSLLPGAVAHISSTRTFTPAGACNGSPRYSDSYLHYDHIGNVLGLSNSSGSLSSSFSQDAWGNVLSSTSTGEWSSSFSGRHLTTTEHDEDAELQYFRNRWYSPMLASFISRSPFSPKIEPPYSYASNQPARKMDPQGLLPGIPRNGDDQIPPFIGFYDMYVGANCAKDAENYASWVSRLFDRYVGLPYLPNMQPPPNPSMYYEDMENAIRHCAWMCCMVKNGVPLSQATAVGDWWEGSDKGDDSRADQKNNETGRDLGCERKKDGKSCNDSCLEAWQNGNLARP